MTFDVGGTYECFDPNTGDITMERVSEILLHHEGIREPENLTQISPDLLRTVDQDYNGVRVNVRFESGRELNYGEYEAALALDEYERGLAQAKEQTPDR